MKLILVGVVLLSCMLQCGCGSTIRGIGKDVTRVGRGIKMIFISEEATQAKEEKKADAGPTLKFWKWGRESEAS